MSKPSTRTPENSGPVFLGVDPGTKRVGYGAVEKIPGGLRLVAAGILPVTGKTDAELLTSIDWELTKLIGELRPGSAAVERLYFSKNQKTALRVAEGRGVILLSLQNAGVPFHELGPNEVKLAVTGDGGANKGAVLKMVRYILKEPALMLIDDASDALALAICAAWRSRNG